MWDHSEETYTTSPYLMADGKPVSLLEDAKNVEELALAKKADVDEKWYPTYLDKLKRAYWDFSMKTAEEKTAVATLTIRLTTLGATRFTDKTKAEKVLGQTFTNVAQKNSQYTAYMIAAYNRFTHFEFIAFVEYLAELFQIPVESVVAERADDIKNRTEAKKIGQRIDQKIAQREVEFQKLKRLAPDEASSTSASSKCAKCQTLEDQLTQYKKKYQLNEDKLMEAHALLEFAEKSSTSLSFHITHFLKEHNSSKGS